MKTRLFPLNLAAAAVLGGLLVCFPAATQAAKLSDPAGGKGAAVKERLKDIAAQLQLTDQQKQELKPILRDEAQRLKNLRAENGTAKRQKHKQLREIRRDLVARIKPILTPEQFDKWQKLHSEMRGRHHLNG